MQRLKPAPDLIRGGYRLNRKRHALKLLDPNMLLITLRSSSHCPDRLLRELHLLVYVGDPRLAVPGAGDNVVRALMGGVEPLSA